MAANLNDAIERLGARLRALANKYEALQLANQQLVEENSSLKYDISQLYKEIEKLESDNKFLRVSHKLADSPDAVVEARAVITALIRDIDRCISELKED